MAHTQPIAKIVGFLRRGYPHGFPRTGYVSEHVDRVARELTDTGWSVVDASV